MSTQSQQNVVAMLEQMSVCHRQAKNVVRVLNAKPKAPTDALDHATVHSVNDTSCTIEYDLLSFKMTYRRYIQQGSGKARGVLTFASTAEDLPGDAKIFELHVAPNGDIAPALTGPILNMPDMQDADQVSLFRRALLSEVLERTFTKFIAP